MRSDKHLEEIKSIHPCIDPRTGDDKEIANSYKQPWAYWNDVSSANYANNGIECINAGSSRISEYVLKSGGGDVRFDPARYTGNGLAFIKRRL